uniref:Uncharacterized protein n=1 Tax=Zea mays TaxID=4577 RepID=C0P9F9_MAIZE|nr:unknown [Zea mays]
MHAGSTSGRCCRVAAAAGPFLDSTNLLLIDIDSLCYYTLTNLRLHGNGHVGLDRQLLRRRHGSRDAAVGHAGRICPCSRSCLGGAGAGDRLHVHVDDHDHLRLVHLLHRRRRSFDVDVDGVHLSTAARPGLGRRRGHHHLLGVLRQLRLLHRHRRGLLVPVRHVQRYLRDAEDEAQHVGERHEHVPLQRAVREPDHGAQHQEEGERDGHELHALGPDHLPHDAERRGEYAERDADADPAEHAHAEAGAGLEQRVEDPQHAAEQRHHVRGRLEPLRRLLAVHAVERRQRRKEHHQRDYVT